MADLTIDGWCQDIFLVIRILFKEASAVSIDLGSKVLLRTIQITGALYGTIIA